MSEFNIQNSKIEQLSSSGNNYKLVAKDGNNAVSAEGTVAQATGAQNQVQVDHKRSFLAMLWAKIRVLWKWIKGGA